VQGYAQRDYEKLAKRLEKELGRTIKLVFNDSLKSALEGDAQGKVDIVVGKHSVVQFDAQRMEVALAPVAALTNKEGGTTMTGLVVVATDDPAKSVSDLNGYRLIFGPGECDEKHSAAIDLLKKGSVSIPSTVETAVACDEGACLILEDAKQGRRGAAVISSYAKPLLEGCGTVEKGALRVIAETEPVPFIEVFAKADLSNEERNKLVTALTVSTGDPLLRVAMETRDGFSPISAAAVASAKKK
jgi:ABC-type phosphate/phosphonate transport system substrate-binding protein